MQAQGIDTKLRGPAVWALVLTGVASFMAALDNLVVTTALPAIRADLGGGLEDLEWTVNAYTLTFAVLLMFGAALGDPSAAAGCSSPASPSSPAPPPQPPSRPGSTRSSPPAPCRAWEPPS